jgi:hypothetical protein
MTTNNPQQQLFERFAQEGYDMSIELHENNLNCVNDYNVKHSNKFPYLDICLATALTWTMHAKASPEYFEFILPFFSGNSIPSIKELEQFSLRFGNEKLLFSMLGLRTWKNKIQKYIPDFRSCDTKALKLFQEKSLHILINLIHNSEVQGVGPWLFLGTFKIILAIEQRLWSDSNIDSIILPSGLEVVRGIRKLKSQQSPIVKDFDLGWLMNEEGSLAEGVALDTLIQTVSKSIADLTGSRVLHINSAFYLYGRER